MADAAGRSRRQRVGEALEQVGLAGVGRRPVKAYSLGMRQRLGLAAALIRRPRLLILDEPGNGLDPRGIRDLRELLTGLNDSGVTVFLSSHLLAEVEQLCTRVGILDSGRLVLQDDLAAYATGVFLLGPSEAAAVGQAPGAGVPGAAAPGLAGQAPTAGQAAGGAVTSLSGAPLSLLQLTERTAGAIAFITVSMLGVAAIALFLSTITDSALGSALGALAALVASEVLVTLNAATVVQPYLPTRYWLAWIDFFRQPVFWRDIQRGFGIQAVYVVVFLAAAWANFSTKDITA